MSVKIGNITLEYGLMLAPMAGVTDRAFRNVCRRSGAEYTVTEMVSAKAMHFNDVETIKLADISNDMLPCAVQIFGHEPEIMAEAAQKLLERPTKPSAIDINMGCPVRKIVNNGEGSALMKNPELVGKIVRAVKDVSSVPVTVKIRTGWNDHCKNAVDVAKTAEYNGADMICIHCRTREQMYQPAIDYETAYHVKKAVNIPVAANGGIYSVSDALYMLERTQCDALAIARGAMGNPWLFDEIKHGLCGKEYQAPSIETKLKAAIAQIEEMICDKGERTAMLEARRQMAYYIKGYRGASDVRNKLSSVTEFEEMKKLILDYLVSINN